MPEAEPAVTGVARVAAGQYRIDGVLDFDTVPGLWNGIEPLIGQDAGMTLSLAGVRHANSAGLALLIEAMETARRRGIDLHIEHLSKDLRDLASLSGATALLDGVA